MCLTNARNITTTAWKCVGGEMVPDRFEIPCYKVFRVKGFWPFRKLMSPFHTETVWKRGKVNEIGKDEPKADEWHTHISGDAFHSFEHLKDAIDEVDIMNKNCGGVRYRVYECVIPKDTKFLYDGYYGGSFIRNYASEKLKVVKRVSGEK